MTNTYTLCTNGAEGHVGFFEKEASLFDLVGLEGDKVTEEEAFELGFFGKNRAAFREGSGRKLFRTGARFSWGRGPFPSVCLPLARECSFGDKVCLWTASLLAAFILFGPEEDEGEEKEASTSVSTEGEEMGAKGERVLDNFFDGLSSGVMDGPSLLFFIVTEFACTDAIVEVAVTFVSAANDSGFWIGDDFNRVLLCADKAESVCLGGL